ncbi:hypothetical protein, partial [Haemophilus parainfluenzae]|uniref:hypothetical protein n=1 Tax=Haemophilus parainfluenzae TaxID=729 RepID=UPI001CEC3AC2
HTTKLDKCTYILNHCTARGLLIDGRQADLARHLQTQVPSLKTVILTTPVSTEAAATWLTYDGIQTDYSEQRPERVSID